MPKYALARLFGLRLRASLASLMVVFVLATAAHFGHRHESASDRPVSAHHVCSFCVSFSGAADAPSQARIALSAPTFAAVLSPTSQLHIGRIIRIAARPRAPPVS